ncbi:hypothetical protein OJ996_14040 [Luteolibacter sp. GHJ8]|uniref:GlsB/YeaQ/YmgE family stress response membrane protein n=1 Tax=Luteolibacter rhizosphaerae TaxID=2989719 RepID=A0ABT3G4D7_9BACT|nr:hypothetical protein [Luteolibacter rhizosphaerae]MCW1914704.1 hypothetical protein [Luteolibacter rhizosphaerae]
MARFIGLIVICIAFGAFTSQLIARLVIGDGIGPTAYLMDGALAGAVWGAVLGFCRHWSRLIGLGITGMVAFALLYHRFIVALIGV